jgi:hypothetical protein
MSGFGHRQARTGERLGAPSFRSVIAARAQPRQPIGGCDRTHKPQSGNCIRSFFPMRERGRQQT